MSSRRRRRSGPQRRQNSRLPHRRRRRYVTSSPASFASAVSRISAGSFARPIAPPPSIVDRNLGAQFFSKRRAAPKRGAILRRARRLSKISSLSIPASGLLTNWNAVIRRNVERGDLGGKLRRGLVAEAAHLDAAARGDLDHAIAMPPRRRGIVRRMRRAESLPIGRSRTSRPSPVGIGAERPGQAPRRSGTANARALTARPPPAAPQSR